MVPWPAIRPAERRDTLVAFATLLMFIASHSVLETARDALFLAKVPATRLPWMYLSIAAVSYGLTRLRTRRPSAGGARDVALAAGWVAVTTLALWAALGLLGDRGIYALYVWSGVLTALVLVPLWSHLGDAFSVTQAKRLYAVIGAGSVVGAIVGSGLASVLSRVLPPRALLAGAGLGFGATSVVALAFPPIAKRRPAAAAAARASAVDDARAVLRHPYAGRVAGLLILAAVCLTAADYVFKASVAANVPAARLGTFLGTVYLVLNVLSLGAQVFVVPWLLRRFDVTRALTVLPALLSVGAITAVATGGLVGPLLVKGADGTLRYSLHRTASELVFVPLPEELRRRAKSFVDVLGQRAGQAVASLAILAVAALSAPPAVLAGAVGLLALLWVALGLRLRVHYLELFRRELRRGRLTHSSEFPELDVASLETLVATLDSDRDAEVLAALGVLEREGKAHLVPALILYHPAEAVVVAALSLFARTGRSKAVGAVDRLLEHPSPRIRGAALAARSVLAPDARLLNLRLSLEEAPEVRATIVVHLIAAGELVGAEADERLDRIVRSGSAEARLALVDALELHPKAGFERVLAELLRAPEPPVRTAAAHAAAAHASPAMADALVGLLSDERTRTVAQTALVTQGELGLAALGRALVDESLPPSLRWQIPRALTRFAPQATADVLLARLPREGDGMIRYRMLRALEAVVQRDPSVRLDTGALDETITQTLARAYRYVDRRVALVAGATKDPRRATPGHDLLVTLLRDKERNAVGRLVHLLGLRWPSRDFAAIRRALDDQDETRRSSSVELLENLLSPPLRGAVVALVDRAPDDERLAAGTSFHAPQRLPYEALLSQLLESSSEAVQDLTAFHVGELDLRRLRPALERIAARRGGPRKGPRSDVDAVVARWAAPGAQGAAASAEERG